MQWRLGQRDDIHRHTMLKSVLKSAIFRARPELIFHPFVARSVRPTVSGMLWNKWVTGYADREHLNRSCMNGIYLHHNTTLVPWNCTECIFTIWQSVSLGFHLNYFQWVAQLVMTTFKLGPGWPRHSYRPVCRVKTWSCSSSSSVVLCPSCIAAPCMRSICSLVSMERSIASTISLIWALLLWQMTSTK